MRASLSISGTHFSPKSASRPLRRSTRFIILHTTEGGARGSLRKLRDNGECHYVVDTNGRVYRIIERRRVAFHAGRSMWDGITNLDSCSIGIEVVGYHDKDLTDAQYASLRLLLQDLQRSFRIPDERVLTHSMVAYGSPNRWHPRSHRGRKRCAMLLAQPATRRRLGLHSKPAFDPDLRAGRLADADPELTRVLYAGAPSGSAQPSSTPGPTPGEGGSGPTPPSANVIGSGRSAWDVARDLYNAPTTVYLFPDGSRRRGDQIENWRAMQPGTRVVVGQTTIENPPEGLLTLGRDGRSARELAGEEVHADSTFYFIPGQRFRRGSDLAPAQLTELPPGTRMLVGYNVGGPIASGRLAFSICGVRWNRPETYYLTPKGELLAGNRINERSIPNGAMVFFRQ